MPNEEIGKRVLEMRRERNMTREELAHRAKVCNKFLYEVENGKKGISAECLWKISDALSANYHYLLTGEGKRMRSKYDELTEEQKIKLRKILNLIREFWKENQE